MKYEFNYQKYFDKCAAIKDFGVSRQLECFPLTKDGTDFLFPDTVPPYFEFNKQNHQGLVFFENQKIHWSIIEHDFNLEVVAFNRSYVPYICIDHSNNKRIISVKCSMNNGKLRVNSDFANSSLEQFAESLMFYREFHETGWKNARDADMGFDLLITSEMGSKLFENIISIDLEATKLYSFWKELLRADILCDEMEKKDIHSYDKISQDFYNSKIWKILS